MTTKIWRGDAPPVAQVTRVTPGTVEIGDVFSLTINGKVISVTATAATAASVAALLAAAITASDIPEFGDVSPTVSGDVLTLTAAEPGVPFVVTGSATNGGSGGVTITTTTAGSAAASSVQAWTIPNFTGYWTATYAGQTTANLGTGGVAISAATLQTALEGLSTIGAGNVTVARTSNTWDVSRYVYTVTFASSLANQAVGMIVVNLYNAAPLIDIELNGTPIGSPSGVNEYVRIQMPTSDVSAYTFNLSFNGDTSSSFAYTSGMSLPTSGSPAHWPSLPELTSVLQTYEGDNLYHLEFRDSLAESNVGAVTGSATWTAAQGRFAIPVTETTVGTTAASEVQVITISGAPTGGTFTLTYSGQTTGTIAYNASAATVDTALEALSNIGAGDVVVTGSAGGPWTVTFATALASTNVAEITGNGAGLTGGSTQSLTVTDTVASSGPNHWDTAANWLPSGVPVNSDDVRFEIGNSDCLYGLAQSAVTLATLHVAMTYRGKIGLPRFNQDEYFEYRTYELTIGATGILLGHGDGSGSGKIALNTGSVATAIVIRESGGSSDFGIPAITWRGTNVNNTVRILGGDFGTCPYSDQTATIDSFEQLGGSVALKHTAILGSLTVSANHSAYDCTHAGEVYST